MGGSINGLPVDGSLIKRKIILKPEWIKDLKKDLQFILYAIKYETKNL